MAQGPRTQKRCGWPGRPPRTRLAQKAPGAADKAGAGGLQDISPETAQGHTKSGAHVDFHEKQTHILHEHARWFPHLPVLLLLGLPFGLPQLKRSDKPHPFALPRACPFAGGGQQE